ncbi:MAG: hypothetical protein BMS9Abin28_0813 [Anaerolineae bacterium]|nr:MAG: hypothetical protein BMS9Abin28_0813 [Anaerolineae bacterium]
MTEAIFRHPRSDRRGKGWARAAWEWVKLDERGLSIAEELISIGILTFAVGIVLAGIYTGTVGVKTRHRRVSAASLARSQLELVADSAYRPDPTAIPYPSVVPAAGYSVVVGLEYWIAPGGPFTTTLRNDGMQKVIVTVSGSEGQILQLEGYQVDR